MIKVLKIDLKNGKKVTNIKIVERECEEEKKHSQLCLLNFIFDNKYYQISHRDLEIIQKYYDYKNHHVCEVYDSLNNILDFDDEIIVLKVTINGITQYYEEW